MSVLTLEVVILLTIAAYSGSRIHQDRKRACRDDNDAHHIPEVAPITVPRPPQIQRYKSNSGSASDSPVSTSQSLSRVQSRRPLDAMSPIDDGGPISRTTSVSSDYGTGGSIGWNTDPSYGTNAGFSFASSQRRPSAYSRP